MIAPFTLQEEIICRDTGPGMGGDTGHKPPCFKLG